MELTAAERAQIEAQRREAQNKAIDAALTARARSMTPQKVWEEIGVYRRHIFALEKGLAVDCERCRGTGSKYDMCGDLCACSGCNGRGWNERKGEKEQG